MTAALPGSSITPSIPGGSVVSSSVVREYPPRSIEASSEMPPVYRRTLLKLLADQARAELLGSNTYSSWVRRAPGPTERMYLAELAMEETEHWYKAVTLLQELGVSPSDARNYESNHWFYFLSRLLTLRKKWVDLLMMSFLIERGGYFLVEDFAQSSYAPWARMAEEILEDEQGHPNLGANCILASIRKEGLARAQRALHKWWRVALNMFGPPTTANANTYIRLGLKIRTNEDRRQAFRRCCEPQIRELGLQVPVLRRQRYPFF